MFIFREFIKHFFLANAKVGFAFRMSNFLIERFLCFEMKHFLWVRCITLQGYIFRLLCFVKNLSSVILFEKGSFFI